MQPPVVSRVSTVVIVNLGDRSYPIYMGPDDTSKTYLLF
jgi:3-dehydroquinate synthase